MFKCCTLSGEQGDLLLNYMKRNMMKEDIDIRREF